MTDLGTLRGADTSVAYAIDPFGVVVGTSYNANGSGGTMRDMETPSRSVPDA